MFNREELINLFECTTDSRLKEKIASMIFIDNNIVDRIKNDYKKHNLIRIQKSPNENTYHIFVIESENLGISESIKINRTIKKDFDKYGNLNILINFYDKDSSDYWYHADNITIFLESELLPN